MQPKQAKKKGEPLMDADSNTATGKSTTSRPTYGMSDSFGVTVLYTQLLQAQVVASKQSNASRGLVKPVAEGISDLQGIWVSFYYIIFPSLKSNLLFV